MLPIMEAMVPAYKQVKSMIEFPMQGLVRPVEE